MDKQTIISQLGLVEHVEGGYFAETHRSAETLTTDRVGQSRNVLTSIYYLLTDDRPIDHLHKNQSDILHYFQAGSPITYLLITPEGQLERHVLGLDLAAGEVPQLLVPGGYWKAAVLESGEYGLLGEAVAPGFDYRDMEIAIANNIQTSFPDHWEKISPYVRA
ncbi:MAG: cupin domain-containing protein [Cyanobacteria bacterium P01_A01_bin.105]